MRKEGKRRPPGDVKPKKHLGQHFLKDENIAQKIAQTLSLDGYNKVLEIGPGTGVLTKHLLERPLELWAMDVDQESIAYLREHLEAESKSGLSKKAPLTVIEADFLRSPLDEYFGQEPFGITGNFPYNISTQIVFRMLEYRDQIPEFSGMFQKEVAQRICEKPGSKAYGILSVLVQAFYEADYLFTVHPQVFDPPPKVQSGVIRLKRKSKEPLPCSAPLLFEVVKRAFNQRRKTLRNSLKSYALSPGLKEDSIFDRRPEQLSVDEFIGLTSRIENDTV